jgi:hypothetical protein
MAVNDSLASDMWYRFRWCLERGHYDFLAKADKCDKFFAGDQWDEQDLNALKLARRPALTINKIISTMSTIMGEQIYNRNDVSFRPAGEGATSTTADSLQKVWNQIAHKNQLKWLRSDVFATGIIRSRGFYDVRMDFAENLRGNILIKNLNSKNVVIDPDAEEYDPDEWNDVFTTKWLTYQDIVTLYNSADAEYLKDREQSLFPYAYDSIERVRDRFAGPNLAGSYYGIQDTAHVRRNIRVLERQYRKIASQKHFVDVQTGDTRPVPDAWDRNRISAVLERTAGQLSVMNKKVKRIRWTVTADNVVLHDDWSPYKHFTVVPFFPHFHYGRTIGLVENLLGPQELLNKVSSQELHVVNTSANSGWKVKKGTLVNMEIEDLEQVGAQTGLVLEVTEIDGVEKITPNNTPQGMDRISYKSEEHMKTISGVSDSMQGMDREDVAAKAITAKRQSGQANHVRVMDNLERSDYFLARNVLDLVQEYYTEERLVHVIHNDLLNQAETITVNQYDPETDKILNDLTLGDYEVLVTPTPDRDTLEDSQFSQAKELREMGVNIPDDVLIENSRLQRRSEIVKQMQAAAQSPEQQQKDQLNMRAMEANVSKLEGEAIEKHTKSTLDQARAKKESVEAQHLEQGGQTADMLKAQQEMELERERFAMEKEKHALDLQAKREELEMQLQFKREEHVLNMEIKQQDAAARRAQAEQQAYAQRTADDGDNDSSTTGE